MGTRITLAVVMLLLLVTSSSKAETWQELLSQADSLNTLNQFDSAMIVTRLALDLTTRLFGGSDTATASVLSMIGHMYDYRRQPEAEKYYRRALSIRETALGADHPDIASSLNSLGMVCFHWARYDESESLFKRALDVLERIDGHGSRDIIPSLNNIAMLREAQGRFTEAEALYRRALTMAEKEYESDSPEIAEALVNLAATFDLQGKYSDAEPHYKRALSMYERTSGPNHPIVAECLNMIAFLFFEQGRFAEAEPLYKRALASYEQSYGPDDGEVSWTLNILGNLYVAQARYTEAEPLFERAIKIDEQVLGPDDPLFARTVGNLASLYLIQGRYDHAEPLLKRSLTIFEKFYGPTGIGVPGCLNDLAILYENSGRYDEAETLYERALGIVEQGHELPEVATILLNFAKFSDSQARYAKAELLFKRALGIQEKFLGRQHPDTAGSLAGLSMHNRLLGIADSSYTLQQDAARTYMEHFFRNAAVLTERNMLTFDRDMKDAVDLAVTCYDELRTPTRGQSFSITELILRVKGAVGDVQQSRFAGLSLEDDPDVYKLADDLKSTRNTLVRFYSAGPRSDSPESYRAELDSLSRKVNELESELYQKSESFRKQTKMNDLSIARIQSALPRNSSAIEYFRWEYHPLHSDSTEAKYLAIILNRKGLPNIVNLGSASVVDSLVSLYLKHINSLTSSGRGPTKQDRDQYSILGKSLYDQVWQPLKKHLSGAKTVFVCPDGELNLVAFAALVDEQDHYLVENLTLHYLSAARDLLRFQQNENSGSGLLAMGDPDFNAGIAARISKAPPRETVAIDAGSPGLGGSYNYRSACQDLKSLTVSRLPYTRDEVSAVTSIWAERFPDSVLSFVDALATEDRFKKEARGKRVIHLATHGYFLGESCNPGNRTSSMMGEEKFIGENPLLLSGLLFAGANLHGTEADSAKTDDGILSAYELQGMDLTGTDLVVLSACESGLGVVHRGEGVLGLRRAFQLAGVRTIVSALWRVQDKKAQEMMTELYSLMDSKSIPNAMRELQLRQLAKLREEGIPDHPLLWAPFVQIGDWR